MSYSGPLVTDFYQVSMAYASWRNGLTDLQGAFALTFRSNPFRGGYTIAAGLEPALEFLEHFHFEKEDLDFLKGLRKPNGDVQFDPAFFDFLQKNPFRCTVHAMPEGTPVFPHEPVLLLRGPVWQGQWVESALLNVINFQSLVATKASRVVFAAREKPVLEFGLRRAQGFDGAISASRAAYVGGVDATSNVEAARRYGIPLRGTHSHSWVMAFDDEKEAFQKFADTFPDQCFLLVDTYSSAEGIDRAVAVGKDLAKKGHRLGGVRLDSGDFAYLSQLARRKLDEAGLTDAKITASNELDEYLMQSLFLQDAKIDSWGVGTRLVVAQDQPALSGVYKLVAIHRDGSWVPRIKVSDQPEKTSNPGISLPYRCLGDGGLAEGDLLCGEDEVPSEVSRIIDPVHPLRSKKLQDRWHREPLLVEVMREGKRTYVPPPLDEVRAHRTRELARFHSSTRRLENPHLYPVGLSPALAELKASLIEARRREREGRTS